MSRRFDRSRSPPRRGSKEWIAKQIVVFGRYGDKRPRGLSVDPLGSMRLSNLMDAWGEDEGLRSSKILEALKLNQKQADGGIRFSVERLDDDVKITVHPKCGHVTHVARQPLQTRQRANSQEERLSIRDKMGMDLDDIITNERGSSSRSKPPVEVIDLTDENFDINSLRPPPFQNFACTAWARGRGYSPGSMSPRLDGDYARYDHSNHTHKVKVSKYVSYIVKRGHAEVGIDLWDGWANLNDIVRVINQHRGYGNYTLQDLKNVLQDTDDVGRFQYWNDWFRKIDKSERHAAQMPNGQRPGAAPVAMDLNVAPVAPGASVQGVMDVTAAPVAIGASVMPSESPSPPLAPGLIVAGVPSPSAMVMASASPPPPMPLENGSLAVPTPPAPLPEKGITTSGRPPSPPGIGWTQYNDDGKFWWYYEGPHGKWWCDDDNEPMPWNFDD